MLTYLRFIGITALAIAASVQIGFAAPQTHFAASIFNAGGQQIGSVNFVPQNAGGVEMVLTTNGLPPGNYEMRISNATACPAPSGDMIADLPMLMVDARGNGAVTAYMPSLSLDGANAILAHAITIGSPSIACGVIGSP
jgi:Cu/Zn superoxide dismutase